MLWYSFNSQSFSREVLPHTLREPFELSSLYGSFSLLLASLALPMALVDAGGRLSPEEALIFMFTRLQNQRRAK